MANNSISLRFLGAAGTVTGSKTLIEYDSQRILIDCGLFQGIKALRLLNWQSFPVDPSSIHAVILTHAHLDHVGYLPLLVKNGFKGKVYATPPTRELAEIILLDSAKLQEEEAYLANKGGYTKHHPAKPLYDIKDALMCLLQFVRVEEYVQVQLTDNSSFRFLKSGHILGSAFIELQVRDKKIVFSGDLGRAKPFLLEPPTKIREADCLVLESTYGGRNHPVGSATEELEQAVNHTLRKKGTLIIPTFAVERAQEIMFLLNTLRRDGKIPEEIPVYLDSPMGIEVTDIMMSYPKWHLLDSKTCNFICRGVYKVRELEETKTIIKENRPKIVIAGSGMLSGGRVLEYLKAYIGDKTTTVLLVGYQAEGTRGRALLNGAGSIKIHGNHYHVNADIRESSSFSGHADKAEIMNWLGNFVKKPKTIFLNHGEPHSAEELKKNIWEQLKLECIIPSLNNSYPI